MGSSETFKIIFDAKDAASSKIAALREQLDALGGTPMVKSQKEINKLNREIEMLEKASGKAAPAFSKLSMEIAKGVLAAKAAEIAFKAIGAAFGFIKGSMMMAANVEELGGALKFIGNQAGYTTGEINKYKAMLKESGIAQKETNQSLLRAIQGNIDLADAVKLGRVAQDAAVIGQINSSEAYEQLINAIVKGRVVMLKTLGIQGTFEASYKRLAGTLDKNAVDLTEAEKLQARLNLVMEGGEVIAGAYETAMGYVSKQIRTMDRLIQNVEVSIGQQLTPTLAVFVDEANIFLKDFDKAFGGTATGKISAFAQMLADAASTFILLTKLVQDFGRMLWNVFEMLVINPIQLASATLMAFVQALSDPFNLASWIEAKAVIDNVADDLYGTDVNDLVATWNAAAKAVEDYTIALYETSQVKVESEDDLKRTRAQIENAEALSLAMDTVESGLKKMREDAVNANSWITDEIEGVSEVTSKNTTYHVNHAKILWKDAMNQMGQMAGQYIGKSIDAFAHGRKSMSGVFKGMAQDFMAYFIKKALSMIIDQFIPGLGGLLGGMFDTPVNDRMAAQQGADFMTWFTKGALDQAGGNSFVDGLVGGKNSSIVPVSGSSGGSGGGTTMHVTISGNVMTNDFIENEVGPKLNRLVANGRSNLSIQKANRTGSPHVIIG